MTNIDSTPEPQFRQCKDCKETFALNETNFRWRKSRKKYTFLNICRTCERIKSRAFNKVRSKKPEYIAWKKAYSKEYRSTPEYAEYYREYMRAYRPIYRQGDKHKQYTYEYNRSPERIQYLKDIRQTPHYKKVILIAANRRRTRKASLPFDFSPADWNAALEYFHGCCAVCGNQLYDLFGQQKAHADHWIPITSPDCPGSIKTNMLPLCGGKGGCNGSKSNHDPIQWLESKFGKRKAKVILERIDKYFDWVKSNE